MNGYRSVGWMKVLLALVCVAVLVMTPSQALAHARLLKSVPADNSEVGQPVEKIEIWFNELLDNGFNSIGVFPAADVTSPNRKSIATEEAKVDAKDRTHLTLKLKLLPPGAYVVEWRVLSLDGHTAPGRFKFRVRPPK
jgi:methionine-rich copper-binding protein CopC